MGWTCCSCRIHAFAQKQGCLHAHRERPCSDSLGKLHSLGVRLTHNVVECSLSMLQAQCELWAGPVAAVAYMPLLRGKVVSMDSATINGTDLEEQKANLAQFVADVNLAGETVRSFQTFARQAQQAQLGMYWSIQLSPRRDYTHVNCTLRPHTICEAAAKMEITQCITMSRAGFCHQSCVFSCWLCCVLLARCCCFLLHTCSSLLLHIA